MYRIIEPSKYGEVVIYIPSRDEDGETIYLLGVIVDDFKRAIDDMMMIDIPETTYAVFTTPPVDTSNDIKQREFADIIR